MSVTRVQSPSAKTTIPVALCELFNCPVASVSSPAKRVLGFLPPGLLKTEDAWFIPPGEAEWLRHWANTSFFLIGVSGNFSHQSSEASSRSQVPFPCGGQGTPGRALVNTYECCKVFRGPVNVSLRLISPRKYSFLLFTGRTTPWGCLTCHYTNLVRKGKKLCAGGGGGKKTKSISHLETCRPVAKDRRICHPVCSRKNSHK